jgi:hypothetical protein
MSLFTQFGELIISHVPAPTGPEKILLLSMVRVS